MSESSPDLESPPQSSNDIVMLEGNHDVLNSPPQVSADFSVRDNALDQGTVLF